MHISEIEFNVSVAMDGNPQNELDKLQEELEGCNCPRGMTSLQETYKWSALMDHFIICEEERVKTEVLVFPVAANGQHQLIDLKMLESDVRDIAMFVKKVLINKLVSCLPKEVPYTALTRILDQLMQSGSRGSMLGLVTDDDEEKTHLASLTYTSTSIYAGLRAFMFFRFLPPYGANVPPYQAIKFLPNYSEEAMKTKSKLAKILKI